MSNSKPRITVRLTPNQLLVLEELKDALNCNISLIIRAIVGDWLTQHENAIYDIIDKKRPFNKNWIKDLNDDTDDDPAIA